MIPLVRTFDRVAPFLPTALVTIGARGAVHRLASHLPAGLTHTLYFECRLAGESSQVDFMMHLEADHRAALNRDWELRRGVADEPAWERVYKFCSRWETRTSSLRRSVAGIWFEFDLDASAQVEALPEPGVFASFAERLTNASPVHAVLRGLDCRPLLARIERPLARCLEALPHGAGIGHVAVMFPRPGAGLRLCLSGLPASCMGSYLEKIGWPGRPVDIARLLRELGRARRRHPGPTKKAMLLHVDIDDDVQPRISMEYHFDRPSQLAGRQAPLPWLDTLVERGLCTPEKRDALHQWSGYTSERLDHELWMSTFFRWVNHVKIVAVPGRDLEAKGYLAAHHMPRARRRAETLTAA